MPVTDAHPRALLERLPSFQAGLRYISTKSVLNTLLVLTIITFPVSVFGSIFVSDDLALVLLFMGFTPIFATIVIYIIWMFRDLDRLHDERTQTEWRQMRLEGDNLHGEGKLIGAAPVPNPALGPMKNEDGER